MTTPQTEPARVTAGDTLAWAVALADYPATDGWTLKYRFINAATKIDITATATGADYAVTVSAATSAAWAPGDYTLTGWVEKITGERHTARAGSIAILPNLAAQAGGYDTRSVAQKALAMLDDALLAHGASAWTQEYEIAGRRMKFRTPAEFFAMRDRLRAEVSSEKAAERLAAGELPANRVFVRF